MRVWQPSPKRVCATGIDVKLLADLLAAFALLTRLPVPIRGAAPFGHGVWAFPIVGAVVGTLSAGVYALCYRAGMPPLLSSVWAVTASVLLTGGLQEDGLADTADGFGGGATRARKLEIMRDSRIGSYGALGLMLSLIVRIAAHGFRASISCTIGARCRRVLRAQRHGGPALSAAAGAP
jgi:adenosylcobinamide-GDP ribazoletransferase